MPVEKILYILKELNLLMLLLRGHALLQNFILTAVTSLQLLRLMAEVKVSGLDSTRIYQFRDLSFQLVCVIYNNNNNNSNNNGICLQEKRKGYQDRKRGGKKKLRACPGFEPGTSRTQSENHTPRPTSHA